MRNSLAAIALALITTTAVAHAQTAQSVPVLENERSGLWFVELSNPPALDGTPLAALENEEALFHASAKAAGVQYAQGRHFRNLWNGLTVRAAVSEMSKVRSLPGVKAIYPVSQVKLAQAEERPGGVAMDLITALKMTGADIAQTELGVTGRGVRVAVIDTGIDYNHPDLGGCFGPGCRVEKGFDLVGDDYDGSDEDKIAPDPDPDDCAGHGTHVSGIIGANGTLRGVAPDVKFHAYRVFGCDGSSSDDVVLAALEMALEGGADVVNMSLGSAFDWPQAPTAQAANRLVKHGIVVVASMGNEGALGLYGGSAPGIGKDVIGVASFDNTHANLASFTVSPDDTQVGYIAADGAPEPPLSGTFPIDRTGTPTSVDDACTALPAGSLAGKVALIRRGTCGFVVKAANAQAAGAAGVVLYNNVPGYITATVAGGTPITIPVVTITAVRGAFINDRIAGGSTVTITWTSLIVSELQPTGNLISSFSSYGVTPDLNLKPDLGAPGGTIRSTLPLEQGGFGNLSGTSMSSPHVAGAVALLLQAVPRAKPAEIMSRIQNTARPHLWFGDPTLGLLDSVHHQGAGMLQIDDAILADELVSPGKLALGEIETGTLTRTIRIKIADAQNRRAKRRQRKDDEVTYTLGHQPALATGPNTFTPTFLDGFATLQFSERTVTLGGRSHENDAWIDVTFTPPANPVARLFGGYITLTPDDDGPVLRVPYSGYNGDYQAIKAIVPTPNGFPWLAKLVGTSFVNQPSGAAFTLEGTDVPFFLIHLDHPSRELKMEVVDVATGQSLNLADDEELLPRNSSPTSFFALVWDGTTIKRIGGKTRSVPNGTYRIELSVLKALGDPKNPAHIEHWSSPTITIARPAPVAP